MLEHAACAGAVNAVVNVVVMAATSARMVKAQILRLTKRVIVDLRSVVEGCVPAWTVSPDFGGDRPAPALPTRHDPDARQTPHYWRAQGP